MIVAMPSAIEPAWVEERGIDSPLLETWADNGPFGARILHTRAAPLAFAYGRKGGPLERRLVFGSRKFRSAARTARPAPLRRRLADRSPERLPLTRSDELLMLARARDAFSAPLEVIGGRDAGTPRLPRAA